MFSRTAILKTIGNCRGTASLIGAIVSLVLAGIFTVVIGQTIVQMTRNTKAVVDRGAEQDTLNYVRGLMDCDKTLSVAQSSCNVSGESDVPVRDLRNRELVGKVHYSGSSSLLPTKLANRYLRVKCQADNAGNYNFHLYTSTSGSESDWKKANHQTSMICRASI